MAVELRVALAMVAGIGCGALGIRRAALLARRERELAQWVEGLQRLSLLMVESAAPLPQLLVQAAARSGSIRQTFAAVAKAMQSQPQLSAAQAYDQFGACFLQPWAQETDQACVHVLLEGLGHGSLALRKQAVDQAAQWLAQAQGQAHEAQQRNGKLAITLGWTAGACLTLLLL